MLKETNVYEDLCQMRQTGGPLTYLQTGVGRNGGVGQWDTEYVLDVEIWGSWKRYTGGKVTGIIYVLKSKKKNKKN